MRLVGGRLPARAFGWGRAASSAAQRAMDAAPWTLRADENMEAPSERQASKNGMHWVFLGCPGVGKGTYATKLASLLSITHIAMGDLVRQELSQPSETSKKLLCAMSQGKLLPDEVVIRLLSKRLQHGTLHGEKGFILDGFPRNTTQAEILEQVTDIDLVINLKLREDVIISKCLGRRICSQCKGNFNIANIDVEGLDGGPRISMPPLLPPPSCASKMTIRADDTEEVVRERLRIYAEESKPVEHFYHLQGKLFDFEVAGGIPETWPRLLDALNLSERDCTHEVSM